MDFRYHSADLTSLDTDLLAIAVPASKDEWPEAVGVLDRALDGLLVRVATEERFEGKAEQGMILHTHGRIAARRVALLGVGAAADLKITDLRTVAARAAKMAAGSHLATVALAVTPPAGVGAADAVHNAVLGMELGVYRFERYLGEDNRKPLTVTGAAVALLGVEEPATFAADVARAQHQAAAVRLARDLVNEPPAVMTPERLAQAAATVAEEEGLTCRVWDKAGVTELGMEMLLAVNKGSDLEPRFIQLTYTPDDAVEGTELPVVAFVGKGLTFDAGGYNLKPTGSIDDMKIDMAGAAAVLGAMKAIRTVAPRCVVHGFVPSTENLINGSAYKTGDVLRGRNGKTVEIGNTDAEGRLILADALTYAVEQGAQEIIDLATLTGACVVALGPYMAGLWGNDKSMLDAVVDAAAAAGEDAWAMPLDRKLKKQIKSDIADIKNVGERWGGAITAALFLEEFVADRKWVHVDLAGPSYVEKPADAHVPKGGSGYGVLTLLAYLQARHG